MRVKAAAARPAPVWTDAPSAPPAADGGGCTLGVEHAGGAGIVIGGGDGGGGGVSAGG